MTRGNDGVGTRMIKWTKTAEGGRNYKIEHKQKIRKQKYWHSILMEFLDRIKN
jgi:hypothetical protein